MGYCYNSDITQKEEAEYNFLEMFDVEVKHQVNFKNYVAKNPIVDDRIFLNGNRLFFLEPMESSSVQGYIECARFFADYIITKRAPVKQAASAAREYIKELQNFVLWHYQFGSKYDTPFWDYAKKISFKDDKFDAMLDYCKDTERVNLIPKGYGGSTNDYSMYGQWPAFSFKIWYDGMTRKEK